MLKTPSCSTKPGLYWCKSKYGASLVLVFTINFWWHQELRLLFGLVMEIRYFRMYSFFSIFNIFVPFRIWFIHSTLTSMLSKHETFSRVCLGQPIKGPDKLQIFSKSASGIRRNPGARNREILVRWKMWHPAPRQQMGDLIPPAERPAQARQVKKSWAQTEILSKKKKKNLMCNYSTNTISCTHLDIVHSFQYRVT